MRWLCCIACLLLVGGAEAGRWRSGRISWYAGRSGYVAARHRLARKGQTVVIARKDGSRAKRYTVCCTARLRRGRVFDLARKDFRRYALPSRGLTTIRWRLERKL